MVVIQRNITGYSSSVDDGKIHIYNQAWKLGLARRGPVVLTLTENRIRQRVIVSNALRLNHILDMHEWFDVQYTEGHK